MLENSLKEVLFSICKENKLVLYNYKKLTGGDINEVYLLETKGGKFVIKLNNAEKFPNMFCAEKSGLESLASTNTFDVPKPLNTGTFQNFSYLIMEYKGAGSKKVNFWEVFGQKLAELHRNSQPEFGYKSDNYIGSLPQYNDKRDSAASFYIDMRLKPQIKLAHELGHQLNISEKFYSNCHSIIPDEPPALIHGDLWNGNYLINDRGMPCLIDPAVSYAPREMDLAMMKLFGGFDDKLFSTYKEKYPLSPGFKERLKLFQLYYLLVHLNLFGTSYYPRVTTIIKRYSSFHNS